MFKRRSSLAHWGLWGLLSWCLLSKSASTETHQSLNEQYEGALTDSGDYLYGSNKWGDDGSGSQNMTVLLADKNGASFNATWIWRDRIQWVHAYPNVGYESDQLPTQLSNVKSFQVSGSWSFFPVDQEDAPDQTAALDAVACKADIALDMFIDEDSEKSTNASRAGFEVMVWQAVWGGVWPIGYYEPPIGAPEYNLSGVIYQLFRGFNQQGQKQAVFSWVPTVYQDSINKNVFELVQELVKMENITNDMYLGLIQFGSETVHAAKPVELQMKNIKMKLDVSSTRASTSRPTSMTSGNAKGKKGDAGIHRPQITNFAIPAALGLGAMLAY